jgi:UDP-2,3-diacylglucosamine pyrophosphatase LpxH
MSDLHFSEAQSTQIGGYRFNRNLPPEAFRSYFLEINQLAKANDIDKVDFILAGDILEITRSEIWLDEGQRPYINNGDVKAGSEVEATILKIIDAIGKEEKVAETLACFREIQKFFDMPVSLHAILGNHDRLVNATEKTRNVFRQLLGLGESDLPIAYYMIVEDKDHKPCCLIRHGHEYDPSNFSMNVDKLDVIPTHISEEYYQQATLGDITTSEFGTALPWLFVETYGEENILNDKILMALYKRLMEFDDVRPTTAWLSYLFATPGVKKAETWEKIKPLFTEVINTLSDHEQFNLTLKQSQTVSKAGRILLLGVLRSGFFKKGIPYWIIKRIMKMVAKSIKLKSQVKWAKKEALILDKNSGCKCVISGHSHFSEVSLISAKNEDEQYYINTGTWRNVIPATKNFKDFGRLKALTKVMVFLPWESETLDEGRSWAFHYMSGVSFGDHRHLNF